VLGRGRIGHLSVPLEILKERSYKKKVAWHCDRSDPIPEGNRWRRAGSRQRGAHEKQKKRDVTVGPRVGHTLGYWRGEGDEVTFSASRRFRLAESGDRGQGKESGQEKLYLPGKISRQFGG